MRLISKEDLYCTDRMFRLVFEAPDISALPGQFVNIAVDGQYLRRPISVSEYEDGLLSLVIQPVGEGTRKIVSAPVGSRFDMLTGLGTPFTLPPVEALKPGCHPRVVVLGGGVGYAPLVGLLRKLHRETDLEILTVFGFNTEADVPLKHIEELRDEGFEVQYSTMTGEMGDRGNALEVALEYIEEDSLKPFYFYTCGPMPMMKAVCKAFPFDGQLSLEARMGCGFGACMGCSIQTVDGPRRICKDGPVFTKSSLML